MYKINELAVAAGVTVRALHYYDKVGLLCPGQYTESGYRLYGEKEALRLQQILFYRELGLSLGEIGEILRQPDFNLVAALETHKAELGGKIARLRQLSRTVENTISYLKGEKTMKQAEIFSGFTPEEEEYYAKEAEKIYDPDIVRESNRTWKSYGKEKQGQILDEGRQIYLDMAAAMPKGADSPEVQAVVERWRALCRISGPRTWTSCFRWRKITAPTIASRPISTRYIPVWLNSWQKPWLSTWEAGKSAEAPQPGISNTPSSMCMGA